MQLLCQLPKITYILCQYGPKEKTLQSVGEQMAQTTCTAHQNRASVCLNLVHASIWCMLYKQPGHEDTKTIKNRPFQSSISSPGNTSAMPSSRILRVSVLRPQPSKAAASRRRPAVWRNALSIMIRSKAGSACSSKP